MKTSLQRLNARLSRLLLNNNRSNVEATFVQSTRMQQLLKTI